MSEESWSDPLLSDLRALLESLGETEWAEAGRGITAGGAPRLRRTAETDAKIKALLEDGRGRFWRALVEPYRQWAETEPSADMEPDRGRGWFAMQARNLLAMIEAAEAIGSIDLAVLGAMSLARLMRDLRDIHAIEPLWERGRRDLEARRAGGAATRTDRDRERVAAMEEVLARNPKMSLARAAALVAKRRGETIETVRRAWYRRKPSAAPGIEES